MATTKQVLTTVGVLIENLSEQGLNDLDGQMLHHHIIRNGPGAGAAFLIFLQDCAQLGIAYPALNEVFELAIIQPFTGLEMVRNDGYTNWQEWRFTGREIFVPQKKKFKLVTIGYQLNFDAVTKELAKHGAIPQGQWRTAFKKAFPSPDGKGPIGIADASWVGPHGFVRFPCVDSGGHPYFHWTAFDFDDGWRWLVEVK